jgi:hypothetical protein
MGHSTAWKRTSNHRLLNRSKQNYQIWTYDAIIRGHTKGVTRRDDSSFSNDTIYITKGVTKSVSSQAVK